MSEFNLSQERAKRSGREDKHLIMTDDEGAILDKYQLVPEWPIDAFDMGTEGKLGASFRLLFADPAEAEAFISKYRPSIDDLSAVMKGVYGLGDLGERLASGD